MLGTTTNITRFSTLTKHILLLIIVITFSASITSATDLVLDHFSISEGLSTSVVNDIHQDRYGFIWLATDDGLNRFDGYNFKIYRQIINDSTSLCSSFVTTLFSDSKGRLWIGTVNGLNLYNPNCDCFQTIISDLSINTISEDSRGNIIVGSYGGLRIIEALDKDVVVLSVGDGLPINGILKLFYDRKGNMLCVGEHHLFTYSHLTGETSILIETNEDELIVGISHDIKGFLWLCTTKKLIKIDADNGFQVMANITFKKEIYKFDRDNHFLIDQQNEFWLGSNTHLLKYTPSDNQFEEINIFEKNLLVENTQIENLYEDKMGNLWISIYGNGVFVKIKNKNIFNHYNKVPFNSHSLSNNIVTSFAEDSNNKIWIGTWGGGINIFNSDDKTVQRYNFRDNNFHKEIFRSLLFVPPSTLWAVSSYNGVVKLNLQTNNYIHYNNKSEEYYIPSSSLRTIIKDSNDNILLAGGDGLLKYDNAAHRFYDVIPEFNKASNYIDSLRFARALMEDTYGNIWVGTHSLGLYKINLNSKMVVQHKFQSSNKENQINNNIIYALKEDKRGLLWIGTMGGGLNIYNPSNKKFYHLTEESGLPNNIVNGILEYNDHLWISTNNGLCLFQIPSFLYSDTLSVEYFDNYDFTSNFIYYDESDGIQSKEFKYAAAFQSSSGQMYFGGVNGFNEFNPISNKINTNPPLVNVTDFYIHGKRQLPSENESSLDTSIIDKKSIILKHHQNFFSFDFVGVNYNNPGKNRYRYRLKNFNDTWTETKNKSVNFMNVNSGEYVFELMAANNDGIWTNESKKIAIIIIPPLWERLWFQIIIVFGLVGILFAFYRYRLYRIKQRNVILEKKIEKRTHQLKESNSLLELQKQEILEMSAKLHHSDQMKLRFFTNISHDFRTPLTLILGPLEKLLSENGLADYTRNQLSHVYKNALKLLNLINELLDFRKLDTGNLNIKAQKIDVVKFMGHISSFYEQHAQNRDITFDNISQSKELELWFDPDLMEKVFSNLLSNAFKYTENGGKITVSINPRESDPSVVQICFEDNGKGISADQINLIFDRYYQAENSMEKNQNYGSGIGLALCKEYIGLHKGNISATNKKEGGTKFIIELLLGNKHFTEEQLLSSNNQIDSYGFNVSYAHEFNEDQQKVEDKTDGSNKPTILIIDDNTDIQRYVIDVLSSEYQVLAASNGEEGFQKATNHVPDLILLDVMMPGINGLKLGAKLKDGPRTSHIPIIIISAKASEEEKLEGFVAGADDYIIKPFSEKILKTRIKSRIRNRRNLIDKFKDNMGITLLGNIKKNSPEEEFVNKLIKILDKNLSNEDFNTANLASEMNLSRTQLYRKISTITEQSASEFIRAYKMRKAAELLAEGKYNVSEVAYKLGFKTLPHFTRTFSSVFKETPSKFISKLN